MARRIGAALACALLTAVLAACSAGREEPRQPLAQPSVTKTTAPDTIESSTRSAAETLVNLLVARPPSELVRSMADIGKPDHLTTLRTEDHAREELTAAQLTIGRDLDILPDGTDVEGGNQIYIHASVPVNNRVALVSIYLSFTQNSVLAAREFSPEILQTALRREDGTNIAFQSLRISPAGDPDGSYAGWNERTGKVTTVHPKTLEDIPITAALERQFRTQLKQILQLIESAETALR